MAETFGERLRRSWNVFVGKEERDKAPAVQRSYFDYGYGSSSSHRPDRTRLQTGNERSTIISSIYTRLGIDVAAVNIKHVRLGDNDRYLEDIESGLHNCLTLEANIDQGASAFRQDLAMTIFDKGVAAIVPIDTTGDMFLGTNFDILTMRVAEIVQWYPRHVKVSVYNDAEDRGKREELILPKRMVAIIENPLYAVMNEPNSTLQRLIRKLNMLDTLDDQAASGKLDIIIQLPYTIRTDARRNEAEKRRKDIEMQLTGSKYGIAYADGSERITQLNRPAENNMLKQVEYLTAMLYAQLGLTPAVFDGTADERTMLNYHNRTVDPVLRAIQEGLKRSFLTKTARTQKQSIMYFRDPFKLVAVTQIAEIGDKFTRNEILSPNDIRTIIGIKPDLNPKSDELRNRNMPVVEPTVGTVPSVDGNPAVNSETTDKESIPSQSMNQQINALTSKYGEALKTARVGSIK